MKYSELKKQAATARAEAYRAKQDAEDARAVVARVVGNAPRQALVELRLRQRTDAAMYNHVADQPGFKAAGEREAVHRIARELLASGLLMVRSEMDFGSSEQMTEYSLWVAKVR